MMLKLLLKSISASSAPTPAEGSVERIVIGCTIALVEDAEHDVDGRSARPGSASGWLASESWNACAVPWKRAADRRGHADARHGVAAMASRRLRQRHAGRQVERDGRRGELALVVHRRAARSWSPSARTRDSGTCAPWRERT